MSGMILIPFNPRLRRAMRENARVSQRDAARHCQTTVPEIARWENAWPGARVRSNAGRAYVDLLNKWSTQ